MSNPSYEIRRICDFFVQLCGAKGWKPFPQLLQAGSLYRLSATRLVKPIGFPQAEVELRIELAKAKRGDGFVLVGMNFYSDGGLAGSIFLHPGEFLAFHGKEFYSINPEVDNQNCWHIVAPKDLDAFLEGYDRLARRFGYMTLFE